MKNKNKKNMKEKKINKNDVNCAVSFGQYYSNQHKHTKDIFSALIWSDISFVYVLQKNQRKIFYFNRDNILMD